MGCAPVSWDLKPFRRLAPDARPDVDSQTGRAQRAAIARQEQERSQRQDLALRLTARGASKLPPASRAALEEVQLHHAKVQKLHGELGRRHEKMASGVDALARIHRTLTRAVLAAGAHKDYGIRDALADFDKCATDLDTAHDGAGSAVSDAAAALAAAQTGVESVIDGLPEL